MSDELRYERVGAAALLTIDRPARRNAIDAAAAEAFRRGLADFEADEGARVLVLTGAGGEAFCAGADLKAMDLDVDHPHGPMGPTRLTPAKPAIAAVDGWCLAGGVELALWCDLRIATPHSTFGLFERRWGVPLVDGGTQRLPRTIGLGRALELILTGRPVSAEEALRIGLVNELVEPGAHLDSSPRARRAHRKLPPRDHAGRPPSSNRRLRHASQRRHSSGAQARPRDPPRRRGGSFSFRFGRGSARNGCVGPLLNPLW